MNKKIVLISILILLVLGFFTPNLDQLIQTFSINPLFKAFFSVSLYLVFWLYLIFEIFKQKLPKSSVRNLLIGIFFVGLLSYIYELMSINYGFPYGKFTYGPMMGNLKLFEQVPIVLPLVYVALVQSTYIITQALKFSRFKSIIIGSILLMLLDVCIDPVLTVNNIWTWHSSFLGINLYEVPIQNFFGWFLTSFISLSILHKLQQNIKITLNVYTLSPLLFTLAFWTGNALQYQFWISAIIGFIMLIYVLQTWNSSFTSNQHHQ